MINQKEKDDAAFNIISSAYYARNDHSRSSIDKQYKKEKR
jgi:hypothetical protein